jgi:hypothetical protein
LGAAQPFFIGEYLIYQWGSAAPNILSPRKHGRHGIILLRKLLYNSAEGGIKIPCLPSFRGDKKNSGEAAINSTLIIYQNIIIVSLS